MEAWDGNLRVGSGPKKAGRRVWNRIEEDALIVALKELVVNGWRADNAFRVGYLQVLENAMAKKVPGTNITGVKHINSKLTVWKKIHKQLLGIFGTDGLRWEPQSKMIVVDSDDAWDKYVKVHPDVENMRFKAFPFYPDWCEIFGKDGNYGGNAQGFDDAVQDILYSDKGKQQAIEAPPVHGSFVDVMSEADEEATSLAQNATSRSAKHHKSPRKEILCHKTKSDGSDKCKERAVEVAPVHCSFIDVMSEADDEATSEAQNATSGSEKNHKSPRKDMTSRKRKSDSGTPDPMVQIMRDCLKDANAAFGDLSSKLNTGQEGMAEKVKQMFEALGKIPGLPDESQILVSYKLVNNPCTMELFLNMPEGLWSKFVLMMLEGKLS